MNQPKLRRMKRLLSNQVGTLKGMTILPREMKLILIMMTTEILFMSMLKNQSRKSPADNNLNDSSQEENPIEKSETAGQILEQEPNGSFADEGQHSENPSSLVDDDTAEPINEIAETNEEFLLNGQPIVMDDIAFNILANTLEMTMET